MTKNTPRRRLLPSRSMSLQTRFMLTFGAVVVAVFTMVISLAGQRQHRTALTQIEKRGEDLAQSVATAATPALLRYDYSSLQRLADEVRADTGALYIVIHDKERSIAAYSGRADLQSTRLDDAVSLAALDAQGDLAQRFTGDAARFSPALTGSILEISLPVRTDASRERWGTVRVGLSLEELSRELARTVRDLSLLGVAAMVLVLLTARLLSGRVTGPLRELAVATAKVSDGELDHTIDEDLVAELGDLARGFNAMIQDLRRGRDALRYQKQHLENMVQERTAALRQKARELERANRELKEVDRLKSDFLSNVSHELRTPLTSIRSFTEILIDGQNVSPEESREFLGIIAGQTDRLTRLIGDLLDLSKIEAGEFQCNLDSIPLVEMVLRPAIESVRHIAADNAVQLDLQLPDDLPPVLADSDRLSQVTMNLLDNALKFTDPQGSITVRAMTSRKRVPEDMVDHDFFGVESDTPETGSYLIVEVGDEGRGIPIEHQQRIFEKFGQVGNVLTNKPQGTGLGLAISGSIMAQLGGAIWVNSVEGAGSIFRYSVPLHVDSVPVNPLGQSAPKREQKRMSSMDRLVRAIDECAVGSRVLVIDDEEDVVESITRILSPLGYRAMGCVGGRHAVDRTRELVPDVVVLDTLMPDMNGYDVLRRLRQDLRTKDIPVVMLGPAREREKAFELGAANHVEKHGLIDVELVPALRG